MRLNVPVTYLCLAVPCLMTAGIFPDNPYTSASIGTVSTTGAHQYSDMGTGYSGVVTSATVRIGFPGAISAGTNLRFVVCHNADGSIPWNCSYYSQFNTSTPAIVDGVATVPIINDAADHDYTFTFPQPITLDPAINYEFSYCQKSINAGPTDGCDFPGPFRVYYTANQSCPWPFVAGCFEVVWNGGVAPPHVIVVPGVAASTLTNASGRCDRWLSCSSIL